MRINVNLVLVVIALWMLMSITEGCRNRPKPFQDFAKRWQQRRQQRMDDRQQILPRPIDDEEDDLQERRWMFRDRRRLFPL